MLKVPPPPDRYPEQIESVIAALLDRGRDAGANVLEEIAYPRREIEQRPRLRRREIAEVFRDDRFQCRYCGGKVIPTPVMELLAEIYEDTFPFHPNWKGGQTHPAIISRSAVIDHVNPGAWGSDWRTRDNLVTACWPCNARKGDLSLELLGWELLPVSEVEWDGLTRFYRPLWNEAGQPKPRLHGSWMQALGV
jgi:5-methylcytosine-specific restriction endonuclease McrA